MAASGNLLKLLHMILSCRSSSTACAFMSLSVGKSFITPAYNLGCRDCNPSVALINLCLHQESRLMSLTFDPDLLGVEFSHPYNW